MPRRCCRKKCSRRYPHAYTPVPRPCVDSLYVPIDFFLPQGVFYSPPCYHTAVPTQEVICECPRLPPYTRNNRNCMASNSNGRPCSGSCKTSDRNQNAPRGSNDVSQGHDQVPCMPSMNHCVDRPPQYPNAQFPYPNNHPGYGARDRQPFPHVTYEQAPVTDFPKARENNQGPPPQYVDAMDPIPPDFAYPSSAPGACCQNSPNYTEIRKLSNTERPISPQNESRGPSPYDRFAEQGLDQSWDPTRYQESPEPIRRPAFGPNPNPRSSFNTPIDNQGYYSTPSTRPPRQVAPRFDSGPSPCCANAAGQKKKEGPPLPQKGISGAHRPGYIVEDEPTDDFLESNPSRCMSAKGASCVHGITSIMPNYSSHILPEKKPSVKGVTCSCKDATGKTVKPLRKNNCRKEEGTEVCESMTCIANKNRYCPCTYPPAFKQYSCTGNITGNCKCTQRFP